MSDPREPPGPDLRPYLDPPLSDAEIRRHLQGGRDRLAQFRRRRLMACVVAAGVAGTAAAALLPGRRTPPGSEKPYQRFADGPPPRSALPPRQVTPMIAPAPVPSFPLLQAHVAETLADSIGVHIRLWYEAYASTNWPLTKRRLRELGVRHVYDVSQTRLARLRELGASGLSLHVLIRDDGEPEELARVLGPALASVQTDWRFGDEWKQGLLDERWAASARQFAKANHTRVRASPLLTRVPLVGPSVRAPYETALVGDLSAFADVGALNFWPGPGPPDLGLLAQELAAQKQIFPGQPLIITQTGYHTAPLSISHVSEAVQARYLLRLHLEAYGQGVVRTFANQLIDFDPNPAAPDAGIGLLRRDGTPKPAYFALKALLAATADPGSSFAPGALRLVIESAEPDLRRALFQRRDGSFVLAVWLARASGDEPVRRPALLRLQSPMRTLRALDPGNPGSQPLAAEHASVLPFAVSDAVTLIELRP